MLLILILLIMSVPPKEWKDLLLELRHDFILVISHKLNQEQIDGIATDLRGLRCNVDVRQEEEGDKNWLLMIGCNCSELILLEADFQ